jgi:phosphatidylglycerol lysyltransferase
MQASFCADTEAHEHARALVLAFGWNAAAYQILNPGMTLWFSRDREAVAGMVRHARTWIVAGAPVCAADRLPAVVEELHSDARAFGQRVLYFGAGTRLERLLDDPAHHLLRLGAQPVWDAGAWPDIVRRKASLRAQIHRASNKGVSATEWSARDIEHNLPALRRVLDRWLAARGLPPLHFMTEPNTLGDLRDRRVFAARRDGALIAFLIATPVPARSGWLIEQWPRVPEAPNGTTHLLVDAAMDTFAAEQSPFVTLGLAPLSDRAGSIGDREPAWMRLLLHWLRAHGRRVYNFRGLDAFKASLQPSAWEPIYAIVPDGRVTFRALRAVAGAFSGGSPLSLAARALGHAAALEVRAILDRGFAAV